MNAARTGQAGHRTAGHDTPPASPHSAILPGRQLMGLASLLLLM